MKRLLLWVGVTMVALGILSPSAEAANVNNFTISDYDITMRLSRDESGRSVLVTTEKITAEFPAINQNRGIERAIPRTYDDHPTKPTVKYVRDGSGSNREYTTYTDTGDNMVVRIGDPDRYVHGRQQYEIQYTQHDVTRYFKNTQRDELYWDTNGTDWRVPIENLSVRLELDDALVARVSGDTACYQGAQGATDACVLTDSDGTYTASATNLRPGENVTLAVGFVPETFEPYQQTLFEKLIVWWAIAQVALVPIAFGLLVWLGVRLYRVIYRPKELGTIVPEYLPPENASVTIASQVAKQPLGSVMTAQLLDLAVRHYIKLYEIKKKSWLGSDEYEIEVIKDVTELREEERELLNDMFGHTPAVGDRINLKTLRNNTGYYRRTTDNDKKIRNLVRGSYAIKEKSTQATSWFRRAALMLFIVAILLVSPVLFGLTLIVFIMSFFAYNLTDTGLALRRHLEGLKMYIKVGEAERLKMLQSPDGAEKTATIRGDSDETTQHIKLYERVLPYAVLFNEEKQWTKQLGEYYEKANIQPDWYTGSTAFNAAAFTSGMHSLAQAANYTSSSSSSSGGSSGGGSSGGGGGGGGGGGW